MIVAKLTLWLQPSVLELSSLLVLLVPELFWLELS
jgi:hypothetical protein